MRLLRYLANLHTEDIDCHERLFQVEDIDLLDAHSFFWTINLDVLGLKEEKTDITKPAEIEKVAEVGRSVRHKDYGDGTIVKITEEKIYVDFRGRQRIFPFPEAFEKEYLTL